MEVRDVEIALRKKIYERNQKIYNLSDLYIAKYSYNIYYGCYTDPELGDPEYEVRDTLKTTRIGILTKEDDGTYRDLIQIRVLDASRLMEYSEHYVIKEEDIEQIRKIDIPGTISEEEMIELYKYLEKEYELRGINRSLKTNKLSTFKVTEGRKRN